MQDQIRLPVRVALEVTMQGMKIRMGRSVVTIMGVVLGIAFLMSILTSQAIRKGVAEEERLRADVKRMYNFLQAEIGPPAERTLGVVQVGSLSESELRLLNTLGDDGLERFRWASTENFPEPLITTERENASLSEVGVGSSGVLVVGDGQAPDIAWAEALSKARQQVVALARSEMSIDSPEGFSVAALVKPMKAEEIEKIAKEKKKEKVRNVWIIIISLTVTVIGIANAMLMSVTERFREIGTMKCLGALSAFVRRLFLIESSFMGVVGGSIGGLLGAVFSFCMYGVIYGFPLVMGSVAYGAIAVYFGYSLVAGIVLSIFAALYPANVASRMVPADALRSNI